MATESQVQVQVQSPVQTVERLKRYRFTADQYERLAEVGILTEDSRVELLEGEIIEMPPIDSSHSGRINTLNAMLQRLVGDTAIVHVQNPIRLTDFSEPQPDLALLRFREDYYTNSHPAPGDILLVIEVSNTTISYDRAVKLPHYALAGIPELWIVDLNGQAIEQCIKPEKATYTEVKKIGRGASISSTLLPAVILSVDVILGNPPLP